MKLPWRLGNAEGERLQRLESLFEIGQLAQRHANAIDFRDVSAIVGLFTPDCDVGRYGTGADGVRAYVEDIDRRFYRTIHMVVGHTIDLHGTDTASGICRMHVEHEVKDRWMVLSECFFDTYVRQGGRWFFQQRKMELWYARELLDRPQGPDFAGGFELPFRPRMPQLVPTWNAFWHDRSEAAKVTDHP